MRKYLLLNLLLCCLGTVAQAEESHTARNINPAWRFQLGDPKEQPSAEKFDDAGWDIVSLPHSHFIFTANMSGFNEFGRAVGWYRREIQKEQGSVNDIVIFLCSPVSEGAERAGQAGQGLTIDTKAPFAETGGVAVGVRPNMLSVFMFRGIGVRANGLVLK